MILSSEDFIDRLKVLSQNLIEQEGDELAKKIDASRYLFCVASISGYFLKVNATWEKVLGWRMNELLEKPWLYFVHPDDVKITMEAAQQMEQHNIINFKNRYRTKDGMWVNMTWTALMWSEQGISYAIAEAGNVN